MSSPLDWWISDDVFGYESQTRLKAVQDVRCCGSLLQCSLSFWRIVLKNVKTYPFLRLICRSAVMSGNDLCRDYTSLVVVLCYNVEILQESSAIC